jgi:5-methylcytosine-specific restriction endonuclease McrA
LATRNLDQFWAAQRGRLQTPRGIAALVITGVIVLAGTAGSRTPGSSLVALFVFSPLGWWFWSWALGFASRLGQSLVQGEPPRASVGKPWVPHTNPERPQLRQDANARFFIDRGGILLRKRHWFIATGTPPAEITPEGLDELGAAQLDEPQLVASYRERSFWWYADAFYWTNGDYGAEDVKALLFTRQRRSERELEHAHAVLQASESTAPAVRKREPIPREVRLAVWERDGGHCVECGGDFELQYDHIIPFVMGGASTMENLQLLCARCNESKGGHL